MTKKVLAGAIIIIAVAVAVSAGLIISHNDDVGYKNITIEGVTFEIPENINGTISREYLGYGIGSERFDAGNFSILVFETGIVSDSMSVYDLTSSIEEFDSRKLYVENGIHYYELKLADGGIVYAGALKAGTKLIEATSEDMDVLKHVFATFTV